MMFEPKYTITPKLLANLKRIAVLTADVNRRSFPRVVLVELQQRARALSSHTSTRIEGNPLPLTEVKKLLRTLPRNLRQSEREVVNYNAALQRLDERLKKGPPALSLQLLLGIHRTVMQGLQEPYHCGRLRAVPIVVNDPRSGETIYLPPDHRDVRPLVGDLLAFIAKNREALDPLILAALFHKQLVIIHPFTDGNGRTARLATKVLLAAMGLDTFPLFSFENYYNQNVTRYFQEVGVRGHYYELKDETDFTAWSEYFTDGILDELLRVSAEIGARAASPEVTPQSHHRKILEHIREHGFITDRDYAQLTDRAKATRALDFRRLMEWGMIERHGQGKNTHYKLKG
jgi:Fic family protein